MSAEDAPNLTSSDQSSGEEFSESEMEGTSDYGSKSGNEDECDGSLTGSDCPPLEDIDSKSESDNPPSSRKTDPNELAEALRGEGNKFFQANEYDKSIEKYKEALAVGKGNVVNEVKCLSNISHTLNRKKRYEEAVNYAFQAIDACPDFLRAYIRCGEALIGLNEHKLAALTLLKGEALSNPKYNSTKTWEVDIKGAIEKIDKAALNGAKQYLAQNHGENLNLKRLRDDGFEVTTAGKDVASKELPGLVASSNESDSSASSSDDNGEGGRPKKSVSPKKKEIRQTKKANSKSSDSSSDSEDSSVQSTRKVSNRKKNKQLSMRKEKERKEKEENQRLIEEVKRDERLAAERRKEEMERKKADELKRKEEERKKVLAMNDPKEAIWFQFNDILAEASSCFRRGIAKRSIEKYGEALDIISKSFKDLKFKNKNIKMCEEVVVIKFMFGRSCTESQSYGEIMNGHARFQEIITLHKEVRFPAVYLGLALLFQKLNRYEKALTYAEKGIDYFDKNLSCNIYNYPGLPAEPIEESRPENLKKHFINLRVEFKCPPKPEAICKFSKCLIVNKDSHIIPSNNIFLSDPDYRGYFKVWCRLNCSLDFHESCWAEKKNEFIDILAKAGKSPTEKDFFGQPCFTPDCDGIIMRIEIFDCYGEVKTLEDKKLLEKIECDERMKKEEERKKREREAKEAQQRKLDERSKKSKKKRNKSSLEKDSELLDENKIGTPKVAIPPNLPTVDKYCHSNTPPPEVPIEQLTILRRSKDQIPNEEVVDKKKHKRKERNTITVDEFNKSDFNNSFVQMPDPGDFKSRVEKFAAIKKTYEEGSKSYQSMKNVQPSKPDIKSLGEKIDNYLNPNATAFNPSTVEKLSPSIIEESIKTFVYQTLKTDGPMKENNIKFTSELGPEAMTLIMENRGLINFLKPDERFGSYGDYICLKGDAEQAKKLKDKEDAEEKHNKKSSKYNSISLSNMANEIREQFQHHPSFGLEEAAQGTSILDSIRKNCEKVNIRPSGDTDFIRHRDSGVQTDVSSLDLDEVDDPILLKQTNSVLLTDLQETKDKLYKIQNERKVESKEAQDKLKAINDEKYRLKIDNNNLNETIQKMNKAHREASRKEDELRKVKDAMDAEIHKSSLMKVELENTKLKLENEQRLTFQLQSELQNSRGQESAIVKTLKLKCLKTDFESKKTFMLFKKTENEKLITHLSNLNSNETPQNSLSTIKSAIVKLNEYSARLYSGLENLQSLYEEKLRNVDQMSTSANFELNFDMSSLESPLLSSIEIDTLRLLTSVSLSSRPQVAPFAQSSAMNRASSSRPPPGLPGPPPGLSIQRSNDSNASTSPSFISRVAPRSRETSSPRPPVPEAISVNRGSLSNTTAVPGTSNGAHSLLETPASNKLVANSGPRNKSYQRLLAQLQSRYPDLSTHDAERYIQLLRENNNGKLSGMSIQTIHDRVGNYIKADRDRRRTENDSDNNCSICLEDMFERDSRRLNPCEHRFHNHCIDNWLSTPGGAGNTCPMCRHYIIQEDEFPDLGRSGLRRQ